MMRSRRRCASPAEGALLALLLVAARPAAALAPAEVPLAGVWRFALDRDDHGSGARWFATTLAGSIRLPGSLQEQGFGEPPSPDTPWVGVLHDPFYYLRAEYTRYTPPGELRLPFQLQPARHYLGAAWYQREITIPEAWRGRRVVLHLERPHWQTRVWLGEREVGTLDSLGTPHAHDLGKVAPGLQRLTIRVDNRMVVDVGRNAHSVTDYTQTAWNGIVGEIALRSTGLVWLDDVQAYPELARRRVRLAVRLGNSGGRKGRGTLQVGRRAFPLSWDEKGGEASFLVPLARTTRAWDEFLPALVRLRLRLSGGEADDERQLVFGLREIGVEGRRLVLNGRPLYLRGTHDGASFPLTGYPPTDVGSWRRILGIARAHGLNHLRFHSWCPPEAAFAAADELGVYLQPECSIWARDGTRLDPGSALEAWLYEESARMVKAYGNHPSFLLLSSGNEPEGRWVESLSRWVEHWKSRDPRRLYGAASGAPMKHALGPVSGTQFYVVGRIGGDRVRGPSGWDGKDHRVAVLGTDVPIVTHELGQHAAYPDPEATGAYRGPLQPRNLALVRDSLRAAGLLDQVGDFVTASGKLQVLAYKEDVEACLRTPEHAGFQLLDLHDYPGQGGAPVGILDAFWQPKSYVTAAEFRRFCNTTVPLARLNSRTLTTAQVLVAEIEVAHFGPRPLSRAVAEWKLVGDRGRVAASGALTPRAVGLGTAQPLGTLRLDLARLAAPAAYRLVVGLRGTPFENDWGVWVYPAAEPPPPPTVRVATRFDAATRKALAAGGRVLLVPRRDQLAFDSPPVSFAPVFWNRQLFPKWERSLGLLIRPDHPALALFPTARWTDWQWESLLRSGTRAVNLGTLPRGLRPIVGVVDDWNRNYRLGLLFEARVGPGRLLVCSLDALLASPSAGERLSGTEELPAEGGAPAEAEPAASAAVSRDWPARRQLLSSLLAYAAGDRFAPELEVAPEQIEALFFETRVMPRLGARASATAETEATPAGHLVDGDPDTFWATPRAGGPGFPHVLTIRFERPQPLAGLVLIAQQRDRKRVGEIKDYRLEASPDGQQWSEIARGVLEPTFEPQRIVLPAATLARALRLTAVSSHDGGSLAALAEIAAVLAPAEAAGGRSPAPERTSP